MVAMVSGEGVPDVDVEKVSARVDEWVASLPQNLKLQVSHFFFASTPPHFASLRGSSITSFSVTPQPLGVGSGMEVFSPLKGRH